MYRSDRLGKWIISIIYIIFCFNLFTVEVSRNSAITDIKVTEPVCLNGTSYRICTQSISTTALTKVPLESLGSAEYVYVNPTSVCVILFARYRFLEKSHFFRKCL